MSYIESAVLAEDDEEEEVAVACPKIGEAFAALEGGGGGSRYVPNASVEHLLVGTALLSISEASLTPIPPLTAPQESGQAALLTGHRHNIYSIDTYAELSVVAVAGKSGVVSFYPAPTAADLADRTEREPLLCAKAHKRWVRWDLVFQLGVVLTHTHTHPDARSPMYVLSQAAPTKVGLRFSADHRHYRSTHRQADLASPQPRGAAAAVDIGRLEPDCVAVDRARGGSGGEQRPQDGAAGSSG